MTLLRIDHLLKELRSGLEALYGLRLKDIYLFDPYARGEQDHESDLDILIILDNVARLSVELDRTGSLASELSLKYGVSISRKFIGETHWRCPTISCAVVLFYSSGL